MFLNISINHAKKDKPMLLHISLYPDIHMPNPVRYVIYTSAPRTIPAIANAFPPYFSGSLLILIKDFIPIYIANIPKIRLSNGIQKVSPNTNDAIAADFDFCFLAVVFVDSMMTMVTNTH